MKSSIKKSSKQNITSCTGLDKETNKELLLKHIKSNAKHGSKLAELGQVLPFLSQRQIQELLKELKIQGKIHFKGQTKASLWFPGTSEISV